MHARARLVALDWQKLRSLTSFVGPSESSIQLRHHSLSPAATAVTRPADLECSSGTLPSTVPKDFNTGTWKALSLSEHSTWRVVNPQTVGYCIWARQYSQSAAATVPLHAPPPPPPPAAVDVDVTENNEFSSTISKDFKAGKPKSLRLDENSPLRVVDPPPRGLAGMALKILGFYSRKSRLIRGSRTLYFRISSHADRPDMYSTFGLEQSFRTTHAMLLLHTWLTLVRLRAEGRDGAIIAQSLYELFNHNLEKRIVGAGVKMLVRKWMKELEKNFYGAAAVYDAAMQPSAGKDDLALALWRNVFAEEGDPLTPGTGTGTATTTGAAAKATAQARDLARYVRREATCLALTDSESLLSGNIDFTSNFPSIPSGQEKLLNPIERVPEGKPMAA